MKLNENVPMVSLISSEVGSSPAKTITTPLTSCWKKSLNCSIGVVISPQEWQTFLASCTICIYTFTYNRLGLWLNILLMLTFKVLTATENWWIIPTPVFATLRTIQSLLVLHVSDGCYSLKVFHNFCTWKFGFCYISTVGNKTLLGGMRKR